MDLLSHQDDLNEIDLQSYCKLTTALQEQDLDAALLAIELLRQELLSHHDYQGVCVEESKELDEDKEISGDGVRLLPVASLENSEYPSSCQGNQMVPVSRNFVSDIAGLRTVYEMVLGEKEENKSAVAIHNIDGTLVLTAVGAEHWGELDPETGEIILHCEEKYKKNTKRRKHCFTEASLTETLWDQFLRQSRYRALESNPESGLTCQQQRKNEVMDSKKERYRRLVEYQLTEDVELLIGSDSLIYAADDRFLAAHAVGQTVSRSEAVDIWLENQINQAENCAVCYHREGAVSGYPLLRTDDLPQCFFDISTELARRCLYNDTSSVFQFLRTHCTAENATYCLTKRGNSLDLWEVHDDLLENSIQNSMQKNNNKPRKKKNKCAPKKMKKKSPFASVLAALCLRIANCTNGSFDLRRRLIERCILLDAENIQARLALTEMLLDQVAASEQQLLNNFQDKYASENWIVAAPMNTANQIPQDLLTRSNNLAAVIAVVEAAHSEALLILSKGGDSTQAKRIEEAHMRIRLALAAAAYLNSRPGRALWHLAQIGGTVLLRDHRTRLALIFEQMSRLINSEESLALHKSEFSGSDNISSSMNQHDASLKKEKIVIEVSKDIESNLNRAIKTLLGGSVIKHNGLLRLLYTRLGEYYLAVDRITKYGRHLSQGIELFRGLGDVRTEQYLRFRKCEIQFRVLVDRGPSTSSGEIADAFFALDTAAKEFRTCPDKIKSRTCNSDRIIPFPLLDEDQSVQLADTAIARFGIRLSSLETLSLACAAADRLADADLIADSHYKLASRLVRSAENPKRALIHFSQALQARDNQLRTTELANTTIALDAIAICVDQLRVLAETKPDANQCISACLAARCALSVLASSRNKTPDAFKLNIVLSPFLILLNDTLKLALQQLSSTKQENKISVNRLKAAYSSALRLQARLLAGETAISLNTAAKL